MFEGMTFDELNNLVTNKRSEPYEEYFADMEITEEQKRKRVSLSEDLGDAFLYAILLLFTMQQYGSVNWEEARAALESGYRDALSKHMTIDDYLDTYIKGFSYDAIDSTRSHGDDPYYYSTDRVMFMAENEAMGCGNYEEYLKAVASEKTMKRWVDIRDKRERKTHLKVGGTVKKITEPFLVGDSLMMFPHDGFTFGASPSELIGCRCSIEYY